MSIEFSLFDPAKTYAGRKQFDCGHSVINKFVHDSLVSQVKRQLSVAYVVTDSDRNDRLKRQPPQNCTDWVDFIFTGPSGHSVSKINQLVSLYITCIWLILIYNSKQDWHVLNWSGVDQSFLYLTILAAFGIAVLAQTYSGKHSHRVNLRKSEIVTK